MIKSLYLKYSQNISFLKPLLLFIAKAVLLYITFKYAYLAYVGLADPNGKYDLSEFFGKYNLILLITKGHIILAEQVLNIIGFETESTMKILRISGASGVLVEYACLGVELWIAYISLIVAYPIQVRRPGLIKFIGSLAGVIVIVMFNVIRMVSIILANHHDKNMTQTIHDYFNYSVYIFIFLAFMWWVSYFSKTKMPYSSSSVVSETGR